MSTQRPNLDPGGQWRVLDTASHWPDEHQQGNHQQRRSPVQMLDKWGSIVGGAALATLGVSRRSWFGAALAGTGGFLVYHGVRGRHLLQPVHVQVAFTINKPVEEVWRFWRNFENLPRFMTHLESVRATGSRYSHWTTRAIMGQTASWHAEIIDERENEFLVWQSLPGSDIENRGAVEFRRAPGDRGTEVHVALEYRPPAGKVGHAVATLFGASARQQVREDLRHLKQLLETGEIPSTAGQPHGRRSTLVKAAQQAWHEPQERLTMPRSA